MPTILLCHNIKSSKIILNQVKMNLKKQILSLSLFVFCALPYSNAQILTMNTERSKTKNEEMPVAPERAVGETEAKEFLWEFWSAIPEKFDDPKFQDVDVDEFGKEVACLEYMFETSYVTRETVVPGDPTKRTVIRKQSVYNTVRNIEKYCKKELKKGNMNSDQAAQDYSFILKVAITVANTPDTKSFESELSSHKRDLQSQIATFKKVKLNNIY
jgi:hypothetical protein